MKKSPTEMRSTNQSLRSVGVAIIALLSFLGPLAFPAAVSTPGRIYLSGTGPDDAVAWEFRCSAGRNSGQWTTIAVPSCWETMGFGIFDYGLIHRRGGGTDKPPLADEVGHYRTSFPTDPAWYSQHVRLVFDGVMTDAEVTLNGHSVGPRHEGAFYRFSYDITALLRSDAANALEVTVHKKSVNPTVNAAERMGDFWTFGGIFRPVWLEIHPALHIDRAAIDARADGHFLATVTLGPGLPATTLLETTLLDADGREIATPVTTPLQRNQQTATVTIPVAHPAGWTAETPSLYTARFRLRFSSPGSEPLHEINTRFGFRTVELRRGDGLYVNGQKVKLKGVARHCFRPDTGRTLSRDASYADVRLIKAMNMNAVRTTHYPPDEAFLEACDELGLYVLDELGGWHDSYDTQTGAALIGEMVRRDVNHPAIIFWNNGNERGWNTANDAEFARWDPQQRGVLHPWADFGGIDTKHYPDYATVAETAAGFGLFMPTEFLHGQFEGGSGAGLADYWKLMQASPVTIGGFLWALADEGVARPDHGGEIDTAGDMGPDGIVGPRHELDGNFSAIRAIWSPLQIDSPPDEAGQLTIANHYDFLDASVCTLQWQLLGFPASADANLTPRILAAGASRAPTIAPHGTGTWRPSLPTDWRSAHALKLTAVNAQGITMNEWTWRLSDPEFPPRSSAAANVATIERGESLAILWNDYRIEFDWLTGRLRAIRKGRALVGLRSGPRFIAYRQDGAVSTNLAATETLESLAVEQQGAEIIVTARYRGNLESTTWRIRPEQNEIQLDYAFQLADEADLAGISFAWPGIAATPHQWLGNGPYPVWRNRTAGGVLDVWSVEPNATAGFWMDWSWIQFAGGPPSITLRNLSEIPYFGLGQAQMHVPSTVAPPDVGLAFLHVIPAIGTKFHAPSRLGPHAQPVRLKGRQSGSLLIYLPLN